MLFASALSLILAWSFFSSPAPTNAAVNVEKAVEKAVKAAVDKSISAAVEKAAKNAEAKKEAEAKAEKLREEAKADAEKLRLEGRADAEKLRLEARADAEKAREEAKADRDSSRRQIESRVFRLNHASASEVAENLNTMWNGDFGVNWKITKMAVAFPESNSILVTAPRLILDACEKAVTELDVEAPQVYIEARFVKLSNTASHKLGIDWSMLDGMKGTLALDAGYKEQQMEGVSTYDSEKGTYTLSSDSAGGGSQNANLSHVNATIGMSELSVVLRALESIEDAHTFSNPKIIVSSGKKATVDMTTKYPNVSIAVKKTFNTSGESTDLDMKMSAIPGEDKMMFAKEAFFSWGISLDVTPRIGTNGLINVTIVPTISDCTDFVTANNGEDSDTTTYSSKYPIINMQRLITEFNMSSGTTAVIGGLSITEEEQVDSGIPWLRDWWWIGPRLFGSKIRVKKQKEIIVFVTVGLVDPRTIRQDAGLPKNAVLGRQYTNGLKLEPGDRPEKNLEGIGSLDMRSLEEQAKDPLKQQRETQPFKLENYMPFQKYPEKRIPEP